MKQHPLQDIKFLFFTAQGEHFQKNAPRDELLSRLWGIDGFLNAEHPSVQLFEKELNQNTQNIEQLLLPLKFYAKNSLDVCKNNAEQAYQKFVKDLCVSYAPYHMMLFTEFLHKLPPYQVSDLFLESLRETLKNSNVREYSVLHDPEGEKYGYSRLHKVVVATCLLVADLMMNWRVGLPCSALMMLNQLIENPVLKEIMPLAIYVGLHVANIDAPLTAVASYAVLGYGFVRLSQWACRQVGKFLPRSSSLVNDYFQNQLVYAGASYIFQKYFPTEDWLKPAGCYHDPQKRAAAAEVLNISPNANILEVRKQFHKLSLNSWSLGKPVDHDHTIEINDAYKCLMDRR